jgi:hypothetical protein
MKSITQKKSTSASGSLPISENSDEHGWASLLSRHITKKGRPEGGGWKNVAELAPIFGYGINNLTPRLNALVSAGELEKADGTTEKGCRCCYYRPKKS